MGSFLCLAPDRAHVSPLPSLLSLVIQTPSSRSSSSNMFGDLKTPAGVKALDAFLADNSYIEGYVPSQADTAVFEALKGAPGSDTPHAQRWYNHIKSFAAGMKQFAKASKDAAALCGRRSRPSCCRGG